MSHLLEIPDELYAAIQAAADASGTTPLGWIAAQLPQAAETTGARMRPQEAPKHLPISSPGASDVYGAGAENGCPRYVEKSSPTMWKRSGKRGTCDAL